MCQTDNETGFVDHLKKMKRRFIFVAFRSFASLDYFNDGPHLILECCDALLPSISNEHRLFSCSFVSLLIHHIIIR